RDDLDLLRGAEADVGGFAGLDAADAGLDEGAEVAGGAMLAVEDNGDVAIVTDRHAFAEVVCSCHKLLLNYTAFPFSRKQRSVENNGVVNDCKPSISGF